MAKQVLIDEIEKFLEGRDPQKYIVAIEGSYSSQEVTLIINDPKKGKFAQKSKFKPFFWAKPDGILKLCDGKRSKISQVLRENKISVKKLRIAHDNGDVPERMKNGYTYLVQGNCTYGELINVFKRHGVDIFDPDNRRDFFTLSIVEQYMIQTGKRLFKGMDDYDDLHRFYFDLETTGLDPKINRIFSIGIKDNRGFQHTLDVHGTTPEELRDKELLAIETFFSIINELKPDLIAGHNSENFDFDFLLERCHQLGSNITNIATTLHSESQKRYEDPEYKISDYYALLKRKSSTVKYGQETEYYTQTIMWGYNIIDTYHAVRRAQAINSNIKKVDLKYITKFSKISKANRVYVKGDAIYKTWSDKENKYAHNDENGDWYMITEKRPLKEGYDEVEGAYIVKRYLLDDLWETEQVDFSFNQATFLLSKIIPTTYAKVSTMGTASIWKLLMSAWSYENDLGIPDYQEKRDFTGGLSRLLECGYARRVVKLDYAALYPNEQLTHDIFPEFDISGVMKAMLLYIAETRDKSKALKIKHQKRVEAIKKGMKETESKGELTPELRNKAEMTITKHSKIAADADKKQLPIKILANSFFGSFGAPYIFPWGDVDKAEEVTCRGRQYLRLLVSHFWENYGFRPLVGDSVTGRTPVYIRYNKTGNIDILPIQDLFTEKTIDVDGQERDFSKKEYQILTKDGWCDIDYIYRHKTDKSIHRITTRDRMIECTSDHSLFSDGVEVKPSALIKGDKIDVYNLIDNGHVLFNVTEELAWLIGFFVADGYAIYGNRKQKYFSKKKGIVVEHNGKRSEWTLNNKDYSKLVKAQEIIKNEFGIDVPIKNYLLKSNHVYKLKTHSTKISKWFSDYCYDNNRIKKIPHIILNGEINIKKAFIDGLGDDLTELKNIAQKSQTVMAGIHFILTELGVDFTLKLRRNKPNIITFNLGEEYPVNKDKSPCKTDEVWRNEILNIKNEYVYDVSANGTFIAGIGGIIAHNTDGFNFALPDNVDEFEYVGKGLHRFTEKGKVYKGVEAPVAEFNDLYMKGRMGLEIDEIAESTINFSRKNYADLIDGEVKLVGNSIKSKKMELYIEEFFDVGIRLLLEGKGKEFINLYYEYVDKIYNCQIPLSKIASKGRVKQSISDYKKKCKQKNKAGNPMPRQAHMELAIHHGLNPNLGDTIYYVNIGNGKSVGDIKTINIERDLPFKVGKEYKVNRKRAKFKIEKINYENNQIVSFDGVFTNKINPEIETLAVDKLKPDTEPTGEVKVELNCKLIPRHQIENDPDLTTEEYNVSKYLDKFNKRLKPLLVVFHPDIRDRILINTKKDKKTKVEILEEREIFKSSECKLVAGMPYKKEDQDTYEELMTMEDKEIRFWTSVNMIPNHMDEEKWKEVVEDYRIRLREAKRQSLEAERKMLDEKFKMLEVSELDEVSYLMETDPDAYQLWLLEHFNVDIDFDEENECFYFKSYKWAWDDSEFTKDIPNYICAEKEMFKYRQDAEDRAEFYRTINLEQTLKEGKISPYKLWLDDKHTKLAEKEGLTLDEYYEKYKIFVDNIKPIQVATSVDYVDENDNDNEDEDNDL